MAKLRLPEHTEFYAQMLRQPEKLEDNGLLVGWSLENRHPSRPIGFTYGDPAKTPATGYVDPILLAREGHLVTIAPTGAGKGVGCIVPALLHHDGPVIVIDPKGENAAVTARRRREMGHEVIVLDPMGITDFASGALNPLDAVDIASPTAVDDAAAIALTLWGQRGDSRDDFWISRAHHLVTGLILHLLVDEADPARRNLGGVRNLIAAFTTDSEKALERLGKSAHPEVRLITSTVLTPAKETMGGILAFAQDMVDFLRGPLVQEATSRTSFPLEGVIRGDPLSIFLVIPPHMLESHSRLLRLWISTLLSAITRRRTQPERSTLFLLDEAAQLGTLPQLRQAITLLRGYGLQTWSFWQDVSQLELLYPHDWETMVNNCRVLQCFGALNMNAAADMANLTGFGYPEKVLDLKPDEMILQLAGDEAVVARLPNYLTDMPFVGQFDANPYYEAGRDVMPKAVKPIRFYERAKGGFTGPGQAASLKSDTPAPAQSASGEAAADPLLESLLDKWREA